MITKKEMICYSGDASGLKGVAERVIFPLNIKQVQEIIKKPAVDIVPRGAGSGLVGGCVPNNSIVVDMSKMNKVIEFSPGKRIVKVEAGITLRELNEKLSAKGFEFPIDVSNEGISTLGGMIATNASGDRSMKYGTMKDWIEEVEFVNGEGEIIKTTKADLGDVCGMEGITGIIVSARLRIVPLIKRTASIFQSDNIDEILSVARKLKSEKEVVKLKLFSKFVSKLLGMPEKYNLIIEFDSDRGKIKDEEYEKLIRLEERVYYALASEGYYRREDPKFFFDKIKEFVLMLELMNIPYFAHLGSGIIHPFFKNDEKTKRVRIVDFIKKSQGKLGKYGIGIMRKDFLEPFEITLIQRVKLRYDSYGRFNRGKVINEISSAKRYVLTPGVKEKISEVKPGLGEERSAVELLKEMEIDKTPEEKLDDFIQEVSVEEKIIEKIKFEPERIERREEIEEIKKIEVKPDVDELFGSEIVKRENKSEEEKIRDRLKDYEETFDSELPNEKRKIVEDFARQIPRDLSKKPNFCSSSPNSLQKEFDDIIKTEIIHEAPKPKPFKPIDYKLINSVMNNKYGPSKVATVEEKKETKPRTSDEDKDIINRIITNRFGKGFGNNNNNNRDKKEDSDKKEEK